jgi:hypothetical protein
LDALQAARDFIAEEMDLVANAISEIKVHPNSIDQDSISESVLYLLFSILI